MGEGTTEPTIYHFSGLSLLAAPVAAVVAEDIGNGRAAKPTIARNGRSIVNSQQEMRGKLDMAGP